MDTKEQLRICEKHQVPISRKVRKTGQRVCPKCDDSARSQMWQNLHPERAKAAVEKGARIKKQIADEAISVWTKRGKPSPFQVIRAKCLKCEHGTDVSRTGAKPRIECAKHRCPLFPFSNVNPAQVVLGRKQQRFQKWRAGLQASETTPKG